ncbi:MAG: 2-phospho-L-lactate transferase [Actinomycetota bacterium]|nr:2-phospho-L-lactate transferase [Actinomycetota bacterium]
MYAVLAGGVGAARFLRGLVRAVHPRDVSVVVNVGDDLELHGLRVCPDLDTITYTLAGVVHEAQGWGRADETFHIAEELARFGVDSWFQIGDRDFATHLIRSQRLRAGMPLSRVASEISAAFGLEVRLLPATDDLVATRVRTMDGRVLHFQEYWVREQATPPVAEVYLDGADRARPAPGVLEALQDAEAVLVGPSNPVVSIGTILAVPGIRQALLDTPAPVVGVSPVVGGKVVRGMADRLLPTVGAEVSAAGVAQLYREWLDGWVMDVADRSDVERVRSLGVEATVTDTLMKGPEVAEALALTALTLAERLR